MFPDLLGSLVAQEYSLAIHQYLSLDLLLLEESLENHHRSSGGIQGALNIHTFLGRYALSACTDRASSSWNVHFHSSHASCKHTHTHTHTPTIVT